MSNLVADGDYKDAALLAFRINKFRDLHYVLKELTTRNSNAEGSKNPVMKVLQDFKEMR